MGESPDVVGLVNRLVREANLPSARERDELRRELLSHFDAVGSSPEALRAAIERFGDTQAVTDGFRRAYRRPGFLAMVRGIELKAIGHAARAIRKMPVVASVIIVSLGVGIGVNTAIFSWLQAVVLQPIPGVRDAARFELVEAVTEAGDHPGVSWLEYRDLRERLGSFRDLVAFRMVPLNLGEQGRVERTYGELVSGNYFSGLGLEPALGRFFLPEEVRQPGGSPVAVISHGFWQSRLAGSPGVIGQTIRVNGRELTILGVAPVGFQGTVLMLDFDLWLPAMLAPVLFAGSGELEDRASRGYSVLGRRYPGVSREQAQLELDAAMSSLSRAYPETNTGVGGEILSVWQSPRGPQQFLTRALVILQGVLLLVLMVVCANTANLMLARGNARQREVGVRRALGATRWRIVTLLLTENVLVALAGAALGSVFAMWGTAALRAVPMIGAFPIRFETSVDGITLAVAALLGVVCGLIFGAAPTLQLLRVEPLAAMRSGTHWAGRSSMGNALMAVEVALALVTLVVAALFLESFAATRDTDPGFRREGVLLAAYDVAGRGSDESSTRELAATLLDRLEALPAVEATAIASGVPLDIHGFPVQSFTVEGRARSEPGTDQALSNIVTRDYFRAMGIPLLAGREFADLRDAAAEPEAIVNEEFVRRFVDGAEPIGRRIGARGARYTIVGVVENSVYDAFGESARPMIFYSYRDRPAALGQIHIRTSGEREQALVPELRRIMREIDPEVPLYDIRTLDEHVEKNLIFRRIPARMFAVLGPLLLVLAAIGIYAVVAHTVARRTNEIGVRLALGATARRVIGQLVADSVRVASVGGAIGWVLAFLVYIHVVPGRPLDLFAFVGVPALLLLVAAFASWIPARRASTVDPLNALRRE
ncbi:MAG: ADOP family duplicated permease [Longimicrobiales bacterium]